MFKTQMKKSIQNINKPLKHKYLLRTSDQDKCCAQTFEQIENTDNPADIYLFKVNNANTSERCEICSKLTIKTPERLS